MTAVLDGTHTADGATGPLLQKLVREAAESRTPLRVAGRSRWIDAGRPVGATRIASVVTHDGIVDYVPGDLTITVRSGATLRDIDGVIRAEGQWLPLDPFGSDEGTIGATIATGSFGPLAHGFGKARDLVLGVEFITGDGKVVRGGGRVVKNVAGFDLVRLVTGSWGTLGIITEVTLRLYALPSDPVTLALSIPEGPNGVAGRVASLLRAPLAAFRMEMVSAQLASYAGLPPGPAILVELGGNAAAIEAQRRTISELGGASEAPPGVWGRIRIAEDKVRSAEAIAVARSRGPLRSAAEAMDGTTSPIVFRVSSLQGDVARIWNALADHLSATDGAMLHATPALGVVRCILPSGTRQDFIERLTAAVPGTSIIYERLPAPLWPSLSPSVVADRLSQGVKRAFDPHEILNPGILGPAS